LDGRDRHDLARPLDLLDVDVREADMPDLPGLAALGQRGEALLERRLRVDAMEVVERDALDPQAAEALVDLRAELLGAAGAGGKAAFRTDDDFRAGRGRADRPLPSALRVGVRRVDVADAGRDGQPHELRVLGRVPEPVRAEPDPRDLNVARARRR